MRFNIPQDILDASDCSHKHTCLTDAYCKGRAMCEVTCTTGRYITFLEPGFAEEALRQCPYAVKFSDKVVCKCPTRYYLHKEYGI